MARSNMTQGHNFFDLVIQVVSTSDTQYVLRAVVYLTSYNVVDSNNNLSVGGSWARGGTLALNGVYNAYPVWSQDIPVGRVFGSGVTVSVSASWSGVEYWGATLSASESYTVPARPPVEPSAPYDYSARDITSSQAASTGVSVASNGGSALDRIEAQVNTSTTETGALTYTTASFVDVVMNNLNRFTQYYFRLRVRNAAGYWSGWGAWVGFKTLATKPDAVPSLTATAVASDAIDLAWGLPNDGGSAITGYVLGYAVAGGSMTYLQLGTARTYRLTGLLPATAYQFTVAAKNAIGQGNPSGLAGTATLAGVKIASAGAFRNVRMSIGYNNGFQQVKPHIGTGGGFT